MEIPGGGGSTMKPLGTENPGGWGVKLEKTLRGGVWIFSGTTQFKIAPNKPFFGTDWLSCNTSREIPMLE